MLEVSADAGKWFWRRANYFRSALMRFPTWSKKSPICWKLFAERLNRAPVPFPPDQCTNWGGHREDMQSSVLAPYLQRVEEPGSTEWSDSAVEPKH